MAWWPTVPMVSWASFDMTRVADLITKAIPVYTTQGSPPKDGLKPEDIVTNQFLDENIHL